MKFEPWQNKKWMFDANVPELPIIKITPGLSKNSLFYKNVGYYIDIREVEYISVKKIGNFVDFPCGNNHIILRIYFNVSGKTLEEMLKDSGLLK